MTGEGCKIVSVPHDVTTDLREMRDVLHAFDDETIGIRDAAQLDRLGPCAAAAAEALGDTDLDRSVAMCILTATRAASEAREAAANHARRPILRPIAQLQFDARIDTATDAIDTALADLDGDAVVPPRK
jgi:hypothetical protein